MNLKRSIIVAFIGIAALGFFHSASSYTRAQVTSPALISITSSDKALIAVGEVTSENGTCINIKNNLASPIIITSIGIENMDTKISQGKSPRIKSGESRAVNIGESIGDMEGEVTIIIDVKWNGGRAKIKHPYVISPLENLPEPNEEKVTPVVKESMKDEIPHAQEPEGVAEEESGEESEGGTAGESQEEKPRSDKKDKNVFVQETEGISHTEEE